MKTINGYDVTNGSIILYDGDNNEYMLMDDMLESMIDVYTNHVKMTGLNLSVD